MIKQETITINDTKYNKIYSDKNVYIQHSSDLYVEAIDLIEAKREYIETDISIYHSDIIELTDSN